MLKAMRKNVKSLAPTLWFVIIAFIISIFAVWGGAGRLGEGRDSNTIVTVNKEKVSVDVYVQNFQQRIQALQEQFNELDQNFIQQLNIPQQVLEQIIQQTILLQVADEMNILASNEEIRDRLISLPWFQRDGQFIGAEEYRQLLSMNRLSPAEYEKSLATDIIIEKTVKVLTAGVTVSPEELWDNYKKNNESVRMEYIIIPEEKMELAAEPTQEELQKHFQEHQKEYRIPEQREADYVFINTEELKAGIEPTELEIEEYYNDNLTQFEEPEKIQVSRIYLPFEDQEPDLVRSQAQNTLERLNQGEDFGQLATNVSKDEKAAEAGDWGLYEWRRLEQVEQDVIVSLSQGDISDVVDLSNGVSILKVTSKEPPLQKTLEEVRDRIQDILKDQKAQEIADEKIFQLEKGAQKEKSLDVASQILGYSVKQTGLLEEGDSIEDIDPSGSISRMIFTLEDGAISSSIATYKGIGLAQLIKIEEERPATFVEVQDDVAEDFKKEKKRILAQDQAVAIKTELNIQTMEKLAEKYTYEYKTSEEHKREQYLSVIGENTLLDAFVFSAEKDALSDPIPYDNGYLLVRVLDRKEVTRTDLEENLAEEKQTFLDQKRNQVFQSFYLKLREEKDVKTNYNLFMRVNNEILSYFTR